ncbi:MAG: response regulator [Polaromonas sp.]|uniref:response regulator n=1 Tax=Polaromonas sp. TaxID=1869339 RepID=UPI0027357D15|nr:response regulator [Polaromonas sp.]MDP2819044.1 response regulator [Polaromonas sp.]
MGYPQVSSAESGAQALQDLAEEKSAQPDIIITDMHMPEMDGVTLARVIKAKAGLASVPLVLLTSGFMPPGHEAAELFAARLLKPVRQKQLFDALARCLSMDDSGTHPAELKASAATVAAKDMTLLVVDDNAVNLKVAARCWLNWATKPKPPWTEGRPCRLWHGRMAQVGVLARF